MNMDMSVSSNESVNGMETMKNELKTNWGKTGKITCSVLGFNLFFGKLLDKQLNYYGLIQSLPLV